ncbi:hypothetical protein HYH03_006792 [Edaphochlamys debaryana]|uniref:MYND-type domain-containing protein n=1 Tax=Edaphochlamys debaryana TaxID=47281 RepID=A0A835Y6Q5_9CHLO|nr:hypothetical protein HYH03_006792 [Edaphochlamys debaryana]|eukprot:KAG2495186.1 hypothetical protein HYH03_006792 [Edaphochlamys debaryana]
MPPRRAPARVAAARARTPEERALDTLKSMGRQALKLTNGRDACAWSPTEINAACEALDTLAPTALEAVGDEGLTGLVIMLGLALRRAAPGAPGISDAQRTAYAMLHIELVGIMVDTDRAVTEHKLSPGTALELCSLHSKLADALLDIKVAVNNNKLSPGSALELYTALVKTHTLRAFCPLLAAASSALLPPPGQPQPRAPRRLVQSSIVLLEAAGLILGLLMQTLKRYAQQPDALEPLLSLLETELAESGLLEHWSRLALALGGCEGAEERAARAAVEMGCDLYIVLRTRTEHDKNNTCARGGWDSWSGLLLSGSSPSLVYLLSSHLVALAAELDGGPTYDLPAAPEVGAAAGPSSSAPAPAPRAWLPLPLLDMAQQRLRPGQPVDVRLAGTALDLWLRCLQSVRLVIKGSSAVPGPEGAALSNQGLVRRMCALRLREVRTWMEQESAQQVAAEPEPAAGAASSGLHLEEQECAKVLAALRRREPFADVAAAYQLGMRLARAAALSLQGCPGLTAASCGASGEGAWEALVAAHDPSGWQDPASPPLPPPGSGAAGRSFQILAAAHLLKVQRPSYRDNHGGPSTDVLAAARAGHLRALEGLFRRPDALRSTPRQGLLLDATWTDLLTHSRAADVASLARTVAKLLRRHPSPEEGLGGVTALARRFGLMAGRDAPAEGLQRRHVAVQAAAGGVGAIPAVGSAAASGDGSGARPDLPLSAACIALQLLPEAARVGRALAEAVLPRVSAPAPPPELRPLEDLVALLLDWMPPLVMAARPREGAGGGGGEGPRGGAESGAAEAAASPSQAAPAAGAWDKLLWRQLDPAWALAAALRLVPTCSCPWELERPETGPGARTLLGPSIRLLREALGPGGACEEPQLLTQLEALSACSGLSEAADLGRGLGASPGPARLYAGATAVLASPAEARRALPGCSNPACTNLAGPSEAALSVQRCGGGCGGAARYCCEGCREAHWAAGHAEECGAAGGSSPAGVQGG